MSPILAVLVSLCAMTMAAERPNILFCIADDWGWPHAGAYGNDPVVKTPAFDRIAREGVIFDNAYISSPSRRMSVGACRHRARWTAGRTLATPSLKWPIPVA